MSKEYNSALQARVEQFLKEKNISQAKTAPLMGISQTALSQYRRSMYDNGDIAALEGKLEEFFRAQEEQEVNTEKALPYRPTQDYIPTSISEDVYKLIRYCQLEKGMVIIHGDAGIGKTKGAERFVRENPTASVYIQATPSTGTLGNLLKVLARALKVPETRSKLDLTLAIREKLEGTNKVIIIDEAQHLQLRSLEEIRTWADANPYHGAAGRGHRADRQHGGLHPDGGQAGGTVRPAVLPHSHEPLLQHPQGHRRGCGEAVPQAGRGWPEEGIELPAWHQPVQVGHPRRSECLQQRGEQRKHQLRRAVCDGPHHGHRPGVRG